MCQLTRRMFCHAACNNFFHAFVFQYVTDLYETLWRPRNGAWMELGWHKHNPNGGPSNRQEKEKQHLQVRCRTPRIVFSWKSLNSCLFYYLVFPLWRPGGQSFITTSANFWQNEALSIGRSFIQDLAQWLKVIKKRPPIVEVYGMTFSKKTMSNNFNIVTTFHICVESVCWSATQNT